MYGVLCRDASTLYFVLVAWFSSFSCFGDQLVWPGCFTRTRLRTTGCLSAFRSASGGEHSLAAPDTTPNLTAQPF